MFRFTYSRLCAAAIGPGEVKAALGTTLTRTWAPAGRLAGKLSDDIQEYLGDEYGGLKNFIQANPKDYELDTQKGVLLVRQRSLVDAGIPAAPKHVPTAPLTFDASVETEIRHKTAAARKQQEQLRNAPPPFIEKQELDRIYPLMQRVPTFAVPLASIAAHEKKDEKDILAELQAASSYFDLMPLAEAMYVRVLPPHAPHAGRAVAKLSSITESPDEVYKGEQIQLYDALRLARFLSTSDYIGLAGLASAAQGVITKPVAHILVSYPEMFEIDPEQGVRFILHSSFWKAPSIKTKDKEQFEGKTIEDLEAEMKRLVKHKKEYSYGQLMKARKNTIHRLQQLKFPKGNVLQDSRVLAYHLFDLLPPDEPIPMVDLKALLPDNGRYCANPGQELFKSYPNLFFMWEERATHWLIQRSDLPRPELRKAEDLTEKECIQCFYSALPGNYDPKRVMTVSSAHQMLESQVKERVNQLGGWRAIFQRNPELFVIEGKVQGNLSFRIIDPAFVSQESDKTSSDPPGALPQ